MSDFTKGKWKWYGNVIDSADTVFDEDMNPIAIVCPKDERESIGRLIAAAPEMYELLQDYVNEVFVPERPNRRELALKLLMRIKGTEI